MTDTQGWRQEALCAQVGGDLWFPDKGGSPRVAKSLCVKCPVRQPCLDDALTRSNDTDNYGIEGGTSPKERRKLRAQNREAA